MKIDMKDGQPVIDASDLGPLLGLAPGEVQSKMRAGDITSTHELGKDDHAGRFRLTFRYAGKQVQLTCTNDGMVISTVKTHKAAM